MDNFGNKRCISNTAALSLYWIAWKLRNFDIQDVILTLLQSNGWKVATKHRKEHITISANLTNPARKWQKITLLLWVLQTSHSSLKVSTFLSRIATSASACESSIDWLPHSVHRTLWLMFLARFSMICLCLTSSAIAKFNVLDLYYSSQLTRDRTRKKRN